MAEAAGLQAWCPGASKGAQTLPALLMVSTPCVEAAAGATHLLNDGHMGRVEAGPEQAYHVWVAAPVAQLQEGAHIQHMQGPSKSPQVTTACYCQEKLLHGVHTHDH